MYTCIHPLLLLLLWWIMTKQKSFSFFGNFQIIITEKINRYRKKTFIMDGPIVFCFLFSGQKKTFQQAKISLFCLLSIFIVEIGYQTTNNNNKKSIDFSFFVTESTTTTKNQCYRFGFWMYCDLSRPDNDDTWN